MPRAGHSFWLMLLGASALVAPQTAFAQSATAPSDRERALEERLLRLEAEMAALRADLGAARSQQAETAVAASQAAARSEETATKLATLETLPTAPADGFRVGGTTFRLGGFVKVVGIATRYDDGEVPGGSLGKEFYLPQQIPVGGSSSRDIIGHARQTRLAFSTSTPLGNKDLKSVIEFDFALAAAPLGAQRATNPYVPTFRRGFINYGNWLIGQEWTTFQNPGHLPETTDFVGPMDGAIFVRQMMIQYKQPLGDGLALYLAAENPQTETESRLSPALVDNDQDRMPDLVTKLAYQGAFGDVHIAALVRQLSVQNNGVGDTAMGWGVTTGGKIHFGPQGRHDLRFLATYGHGMGRYFTVGFAPDAIYDAAIDNRLYVVNNFAGFAALKLGWTPTIRSTLMVGYQHVDYPANVIIPGMSNREAYSFAGNLFWSPVKNLDFGIEFRHAQREVVSGLKGQMDRVEMAAKYTF